MEMADKKNNKRKFAALALALVGVAGLSVASAATLTVEASPEVAIGTATFAACDNSVEVDYDYSPTSFLIDEVTVTDIAAACLDEEILVVIEDSAVEPAELARFVGTVEGGTVTFEVAQPSIAVSTDLGDVTVVIG